MALFIVDMFVQTYRTSPVFDPIPKAHPLYRTLEWVETNMARESRAHSALDSAPEMSTL